MNENKPFVIQLVIGAVLVGAGILTHFDYYSTLLFAIGCGLASSSIVHMARMIYWQNPKRRDEFTKKKQEAHVNSIDERKQLIRMKSGQITYQIMTFSLLGLSFVLALFRVSSLVVALLFILFILNWAVGTVVYHVLEKRM